MKLSRIAAIRITHFPSEPVSPETSLDLGSGNIVTLGGAEPAWPEMIAAKISIALRDDVTPEGVSDEVRDFTTRFRSGADVTLAVLERRALQQLASELRSLAEALDAEIAERAGLEPL